MAKAWDCPKRGLQSPHGWRSVRAGCPYWPSQGRGGGTSNPVPSGTHIPKPAAWAARNCLSNLHINRGNVLLRFYLAQTLSGQKQQGGNKQWGKKVICNEQLWKNEWIRKRGDGKKMKEERTVLKPLQTLHDTTFVQPGFQINYFLFQA